MTQGRVISIAVFLLAVTLACITASPADDLAGTNHSPMASGRTVRVTGQRRQGTWNAAAPRVRHEPRPRRQATFYLAEVYVQLGDLARARQLYESFLADMGDDPQVTVIRARFRLGEMSYLLREDERSQRELRGILWSSIPTMTWQATRHGTSTTWLPAGLRRSIPHRTLRSPRRRASAMIRGILQPAGRRQEIVSRRKRRIAGRETRTQSPGEPGSRHESRLLEAYQRDEAM